MNQSELKANTCSRHQARENVSEQITIGFSFVSDWSRKRHERMQTKQSNEIQSNANKVITKLLSTINWKPRFFH